MRVAAVAILCQDERVFEAMIQAGTVCPIDGKIGRSYGYGLNMIMKDQTMTCMLNV